MKKLRLLFLICILSISGTNAQQSVSWNSSADNGNWWNGTTGNTLHWIRSCDGYWIKRPDYNTCKSSSTNIGPNNITFDNNIQTSMNVNGAWFQINELTFSTNASSVRTLTADQNGGLSFKGSNSYIKNNSTATHIFSTGIGVDGSKLTVDAAGGGLTFNNPININANSLIFSGNSNVTVNGVLSGTGTLTQNAASTLTFTVANTYTGTTTVNSGTLELKNSLASSTITVKTDATLKISENATINNLIVESGGTLTIVDGKTLTINAGKQVTINGTVNYNSTGKIKLLSDENGTATLTGSYSGPAEVNQYLAYRTWYMSSPVADAQPTGMNRIKYYNEANNSWPTLFDARTETAVPYGTNKFEIGKGYQVVPDNDDTGIQFSGVLNNGNIAVALTRSAATNTAKPGFNLIGNPYPSYLDWVEVCQNASYGTANKAIMPTTTMWYRTKAGAYDFWTVNGLGEVSPAAASRYIPPMQAFWVRTISGGSLQLTNDMRAHAPASNYLFKAPSAKNTENARLRLQVSNGTNTDETLIYFNENVSNGLDMYDSPKMSNNDASIPEIFTRSGNEQLVINGLNSIPRDTEIPVGFVAGSATSFSIKANEISNLPSDIKVILKDNITKAETDLTDGTSIYEFAPAATTSDRFSIIFRTVGTTTGLDNTGNENVFVYTNKRNQLTISYSASENSVPVAYIYNSVGQCLAIQSLTSTITVIDKYFASGVYVVRVNNVTRKVVVE
jgi:autotransporter-associated beta strand protein